MTGLGIVMQCAASGSWPLCLIIVLQELVDCRLTLALGEVWASPAPLAIFGQRLRQLHHSVRKFNRALCDELLCHVKTICFAFARVSCVCLSSRDCGGDKDWWPSDWHWLGYFDRLECALCIQNTCALELHCFALFHIVSVLLIVKVGMTWVYWMFFSIHTRSHSEVKINLNAVFPGHQLPLENHIKSTHDSTTVLCISELRYHIFLRWSLQERPCGNHSKWSREPHHAVLCGFCRRRKAHWWSCQEPGYHQSHTEPYLSNWLILSVIPKYELAIYINLTWNCKLYFSTASSSYCDFLLSCVFFRILKTQRFWSQKRNKAKPPRTIFDVKRLMGRRFKDSTVQKDMKLLPYTIVEKTGKPVISVQVKGEERIMAPEEISSMVLSKMKETAENYLGQVVRHAVVGNWFRIAMGLDNWIPFFSFFCFSWCVFVRGNTHR